MMNVSNLITTKYQFATTYRYCLHRLLNDVCLLLFVVQQQGQCMTLLSYLQHTHTPLRTNRRLSFFFYSLLLLITFLFPFFFLFLLFFFCQYYGGQLAYYYCTVLEKIYSTQHHVSVVQSNIILILLLVVCRLASWSQLQQERKLEHYVNRVEACVCGKVRVLIL